MVETESNVHKFNTTNKTQYLVEELKPYTNYSFWVHAETSAGLGNKSDTKVNTTFEGGNLSWNSTFIFRSITFS